jgi:acetyltransferase-like isoleucine patch superfamily enzyme
MSKHVPAILLGSLSRRLRLCSSVLWRLEAKFRGVEFQGSCEFYGRPIISLAPNGRIVLGDGVRIASSVRANPLGLSQPTVLRALAPGAQVIVGPGVGMSGAVLCAGACIEVGQGTIMGAGAMIVDNDFHVPVGEWEWSHDSTICARIARPVKIGRGVFIGARAVILKGVTVGDRAVVGAGAVVTRDVPPYYLAAGNPAKNFLAKPQSAVRDRSAGSGIQSNA